jgi:hypothetical protein
MRISLSEVVSFVKYMALSGWFNRRRIGIINIWAAIETTIDDANSAAWEMSGRTISAVVPQNLGRKIELFKQIHNKLPAFAPLKSEAVALIEKLSALKDDRHWLVHGSLSEESGRGWTLQKTEFQRDGSVEIVARTISRAELSKIEGGVHDLLFDMVRYADALRLKVAEHFPDDDGG